MASKEEISRRLQLVVNEIERNHSLNLIPKKQVINLLLAIKKTVDEEED